MTAPADIAEPTAPPLTHGQTVTSTANSDVRLPLPFAQLQLLMQVPALLVIGVLVGLHSAIWGSGATAFVTWAQTFGLIGAWMAGLIVHEVLHAAAFVTGGAEWADVRIGIRKLTPYFHCDAAVPVSGFRSATLLPALVLGVLPAAAGLGFGLPVVTWFGSLMLSASLGDLLTLWVIRSVPGDARIVYRPLHETYEVTPA